MTIYLRHLILVVTAIGCHHDLPSLYEYPSASVAFIDSAEDLPPNCTHLGRIYAEDGWVGSRRWAYEGTQERALHRLRNDAVEIRANYVVLDRDKFALGLPVDEARGRSYRVEGQAYRCEH
jgi:hypothetical protein